MAVFGDLGSTGFKLLLQLLTGLIIVIVLAALFFGGRAAFGAYRRYKNYKITALIHNPDGTFYTRKMGKFRTADKVDKMLFMGSTETMPVIDPKYIRNNQVELWRYGVGQYGAVPQSVWGKNPKEFGIEVIDFQMKNFAFLEQRASISRWAYMRDLLQKWAPFITMVLLCILTGVALWFMMKAGQGIYSQAIAARILECKTALGVSSAPTA